MTDVQVPLPQRVAALLSDGGLVVVHGGPGCGRSTVLRDVAAAFRGPVHAGGALAALATTPAFALSHALRVRLPVHDPPLLVEAVRARVGAGLLVLDDLHLADPLTLHTVTALAGRCRMVAALRTPHRLPAATCDALRTAAAGWLAVPPLDRAAAVALARSTAPGLDGPTVTAVVDRAGGLPLAVTALARHAAAAEARAGDDLDQVGYAVAVALTDLPRPARTALATLGLLGRPAPAGLLGAAVADLTAAGLLTTDGGTVSPTCPYVAEVAAGLLDDDTRRALHRRLAAVLPAVEAVGHLTAAGDTAEAYRLAVTAAATAGDDTARADLLGAACALPHTDPPAEVRLAAARAALTVARPDAALRALHAPGPLGVRAAVLRAEALLHLSDPAGARTAVSAVPDTAETTVVAARDRIRLLADLADDPRRAPVTAATLTARHGHRPTDPGLRAALAAFAAAVRAPGWEQALTDAADNCDDRLTAAWSGWLLAHTLATDARLPEARHTTARHVTRHSYGWSTRFAALHLWCRVLGGQGTTATATDLPEGTLHPVARGYVVAAVALAEADAGLLTAARARLAATGTHPAVDWVAAETAWLDGQPGHVHPPPDAPAGLIAGLHRITGHWAVRDGATVVAGRPPADALPTPVAATVAALDGHGDLPAAAAAWADLVPREQVRCLLAHALDVTARDPAVAALTTAGQVADTTGLVVLAGRVRRALRAHGVTGQPGPRTTGGSLTDREQQVLRLVAAGEPSRRIAGRLGVSTETVETHVRAGMRKLGARTRTEAAALAVQVTG